MMSGKPRKSRLVSECVNCYVLADSAVQQLQIAAGVILPEPPWIDLAEFTTTPDRAAECRVGQFVRYTDNYGAGGGIITRIDEGKVSLRPCTPEEREEYGAVIEEKGRREMTIEEVKAKRTALQSMLYTAFKEFERETGVIIDSVDVRHIDLSTVGGPHVLTPDVRVQLKWD